MRDPELLILDEPTAGLDLPGREAFLTALDALAGANDSLTTVVVTHHVEELPSKTSHALLLRAGRVVTAGAVGAALTAESLSEAFGLPIAVHRVGGRYAAVAATAERHR